MRYPPFLFPLHLPMFLQTTPVVFDCPPNSNNPPGRVLKMTAKRYCTSQSVSNDEGFSLLFAHCIGARTIFCPLAVSSRS